MRVLTVCGMGFGTSLMLLMMVQEIAKKHGVIVEGEAVDLGAYKGKACDVIMASSEIAKQIQSDKPVIGVNNLLDKAGIEKSILPYLK
ncbi:MAG: PTS sugar transporter subunit IIB [Treponema sp.]|nr:PTS sugar transporter subunit IIB [Treponema sp.]